MLRATTSYATAFLIVAQASNQQNDEQQAECIEEDVQEQSAPEAGSSSSDASVGHSIQDAAARLHEASQCLMTSSAEPLEADAGQQLDEASSTATHGPPSGAPAAPTVRLGTMLWTIVRKRPVQRLLRCAGPCLPPEVANQNVLHLLRYPGCRSWLPVRTLRHPQSAAAVSMWCGARMDGSTVDRQMT